MFKHKVVTIINVEMSEFKKKIKTLSSEDLLDLTNMAKLLGHSGFSENMDMTILRYIF